MELYNKLLPNKLVEAFKDVTAIEEVKKFLVPYDTIKELEYLPHINDQELMSIIDIPKEKMLFGEIYNLDHAEGCFEIFNPCIDFFNEIMWGSRFYLDFIKIEPIKSEVIGSKISTGFIARRVKDLRFNLKDTHIDIFELSWTKGQGGDPWYFVMNEDDLQVLCDHIFSTKPWDNQFSKYLAARIMENCYMTRIASHVPVLGESVPDFDLYVDDIIRSRHLDEYHWWENR